MVTPDDSSRIVFTKGLLNAGIVWNAPPILAGPFEGQPASKPFHTNRLVAIFVPSPPSHGTERLRAENNAQHKAPKNITSETHNHTLSQRKVQTNHAARPEDRSEG